MFPCNGVTICFTYKGELSLTYPCNRTQVRNPLLCTEAAMSEAAKIYINIKWEIQTVFIFGYLKQIFWLKINLANWSHRLQCHFLRVDWCRFLTSELLFKSLKYVLQLYTNTWTSFLIKESFAGRSIFAASNFWRNSIVFWMGIWALSISWRVRYIVLYCSCKESVKLVTSILIDIKIKKINTW